MNSLGEKAASACAALMFLTHRAGQSPNIQILFAMIVLAVIESVGRIINFAE